MKTMTTTAVALPDDIVQGSTAIGERYAAFVTVTTGWCDTKGKRRITCAINRTMKPTQRRRLREEFESLLRKNRDICAVERFYYPSEGVSYWFSLISERPPKEKGGTA